MAKIILDARKQGIVDVDPANLNTLEIATKLVEKHKGEAFKRLDERLKKQANNLVRR